MQVLNAANELQDLILAHHRLLDRLGLWHGHVFCGIGRKELQLFRHLQKRSNVDVAVANHRLGEFRCRLIEPDLEFKRAQLVQLNPPEMLYQVMLESRTC
jgi:hypothetical protein